MADYVFTLHARDMLKEREIPEQWVLDAISVPDEKSIESDGNTHYFKSLSERENRVLHLLLMKPLNPAELSPCFWIGEGE